MKRSKRVITGTCRDVTAHSAAMKNMKIEDFRQKINALPKHITLVNMDETPVYFNSIPKRTVTSKGEKHVKARVAGDEKKRVTVVLGCCSNGEKLPPMIITKQSLRGVTVPQGMLLRRQPKAWMTSDLMLDWFNHCKTYIKDKHLLLDSFSGHKTKQVNDTFESSNTAYTLIPPGCTSELQPLDLGLNKPFKDRLKRKWLQNQAQNCRIPLEKLLSWISDCWNSITTVSILNSFKAAL